jgi:predicted TIM-barrel fold metal-dependent hydrolase
MSDNLTGYLYQNTSSLLDHYLALAIADSKTMMEDLEEFKQHPNKKIKLSGTTSSSISTLMTHLNHRE